MGHYFAIAASGSSYLYEQRFTTGADPGDIFVSGSPNFAFASPALAGSYSLGLTDPALIAHVVSPQMQFDGYFMFRAENVTANRGVFALVDGSDDHVLRVSIDSSGFILWDALDTHYAQPAVGISANTTYHVWYSYVKGTGSNAVLTFAFSTNGTRPVSGTQFCTITNGASTTDGVALAYFGGPSSTNHIFDNSIGATTAGSIGNSP